MLTSKDVRYWFEVQSQCRVKDDKSLEWLFNEVDVTRLCDEIAQAAEENKADALAELNRGWRASECARLRTIAGLQAQVAVMARVVGTLRSRYLDALDALEAEGKLFVNAFRRELRDLDVALSAAPKVVIHKAARLLTFDDKSQVLIFPQDKYFGAEEAADQYEYNNPTDGLPDSVGFPKVEDVEVFVTAKPEQGQKSEQSDAQGE